MTDLDLTKLREIAVAATPGEWTAEIRETRRRSPQTRRWLKWKPEHGTHGFVSIVESDGAYGVFDGPDARHVATFDPPTVLALIDMVERLRTITDAQVEAAAEELTIDIDGSEWDEISPKAQDKVRELARQCLEAAREARE